MKSLFLILSFIIVLSFGGNGQSDKVTLKHLENLAATMSGTFSSANQALEDSDYYHIVLRMKPIWTKSNDGYWLYVEQAMASAEQRPYRQRVYHVFLLNDTTIVSKVFELKSPSKYIGGWKDDERLSYLTEDSLVDRQGCAIYLHKKGEIFRGSTPGMECLSNLRGASYATSEVVIYPDRLVSWDRGWDKAGKQVWGAEKGGYIFIKKAGW